MSKPIVLKSVIVQRLIRSPFADKYYRLSPQMKPIATIDIEEFETRDQLLKYWNEIVRLEGNFALLARNGKGRFERNVAIMRVTNGSITFKDERCMMAQRFRKNSEIREQDMEI